MNNTKPLKRIATAVEQFKVRRFARKLERSIDRNFRGQLEQPVPLPIRRDNTPPDAA